MPLARSNAAISVTLSLQSPNLFLNTLVIVWNDAPGSEVDCDIADVALHPGINRRRLPLAVGYTARDLVGQRGYLRRYGDLGESGVAIGATQVFVGIECRDKKRWITIDGSDTRASSDW